MNRLTAINNVIAQLGEQEFVFHANGAMARESCYCKDRQRNFYLVGSMGLASSVGLGFAIQRPDEKTVVLDGDGNLLMGLGNLAIIAAAKPENLLHIVLDNNAYATTGNQPTISNKVALEKLAEAAGYPTVMTTESEGDIASIIPQIWDRPGPRFLLIKIDDHSTQDIPRIPYTAAQNKERFME
jgi:thiamine pyrophosphate-dependent acetolactate synthase large subunit-like protein